MKRLDQSQYYFHPTSLNISQDEGTRVFGQNSKNLFKSAWVLHILLIVLLSRDCERFCNFKSLLYRVRFECVSLLHCFHLFFFQHNLNLRMVIIFFI